MKIKIHNVQIITSIMLKETHLFEKKDDDEVRKLQRSKELQKETSKKTRERDKENRLK